MRQLQPAREHQVQEVRRRLARGWRRRRGYGRSCSPRRSQGTRCGSCSPWRPQGTRCGSCSPWRPQGTRRGSCSPWRPQGTRRLEARSSAPHATPRIHIGASRGRYARFYPTREGCCRLVGGDEGMREMRGSHRSRRQEGRETSGIPKAAFYSNRLRHSSLHVSYMFRERKGGEIS